MGPVYPRGRSQMLPSQPPLQLRFACVIQIPWGEAGVWKLWKWRHIHAWSAATLSTMTSNIPRTGREYPDLGVGELRWGSVGSRTVTSQRCPCPTSQHLNMCFPGTKSWAYESKWWIWGLRGSIGLFRWDWCNGGDRRLMFREDIIFILYTTLYYIIMEEEGKKEIWDEDMGGGHIW